MKSPVKYHERVKAILAAPKTVPASWRMVLIALADHHRYGEDDSHYYPGQKRLAEMAGLSRKGIMPILRKLERAGYIIAERRPGLTHQYMIDWSKLSEVVHGGDMSTEVTRGVVHGGDMSTEVTCPQTSQGLSTEVTGVVHGGDTNREKNRGSEQVELNSPCSPPTGDLSDRPSLQLVSPEPKQTEQAPAPSPPPAQKPKRQKRTRKTTALSVEAIHAVPLPAVLAELPGFSESWLAWTAVRHKAHARHRWVDTSQIEAVLAKLTRWYDEGLDVVKAVEQAHERGWQGFKRSFLDPRPGVQTASGTTAEEAWQAVRQGLARGGHPNRSAGFFHTDEAISAAIWQAIQPCGRWSDLSRKPEWALEREVKPQFLRRFRRPDHQRPDRTARHLNTPAWRTSA